MICSFKTLALTALFVLICALTETGEALECYECSLTKVTKIAGFDTYFAAEGDQTCWTDPEAQSTVNCTAGAGQVARCMTQNMKVTTTILVDTVTKIQSRRCIIVDDADDPGNVCQTDLFAIPFVEVISGLDVKGVSGSHCLCTDEDLCNGAISIQSAATWMATALIAVVAYIVH